MSEFLATGCLKDEIDDRDKIYETEFLISANENNNDYNIDLRDEFMPKIYSQGIYGSCVAHAVMRSYEYQLNKLYKNIGLYLMMGKADCKFSRQFLYYMARLLSGTVRTDGGANPRNGCKAIKKWGVPTEDRHIYSLGWQVQPSSDALIYADENKITSYYRITSYEGIIQSLKNGIPVLISTDVFQFDDAKINGYSQKSLTWNKHFATINHEMVICGIKTMDYLGQKLDCFIIANSWGENYADKGWVYLPARQLWDYNLGDAWVIIVDINSLKQDNPIDEPIVSQMTIDNLPVGTVVVGDEAYSKVYLKTLAENNDVKHQEITDKMNKNMDKFFTKNDKGIFESPLGFDFVRPMELTYYNDFGQVEIIK